MSEVVVARGGGPADDIVTEELLSCDEAGEVSFSGESIRRRLLNIIKHCVEDAVASASGASRQCQWSQSPVERGGKNTCIFLGVYDVASPPGGAKSGSWLHSLSQQNNKKQTTDRNAARKCCTDADKIRLLRKRA